ncbi:hypothetical protein CLU88_1554 [Acidovorax sp. 56]|nr:hypothetical protein CLU88_1554 [Acidovorax sp. 56]
MQIGRKWFWAAGALVVGGASVQPSPSLAEATSLAPTEHQFHAECYRPDVELCAIKNPGPSIYKVLTPGIPFDDLVSHWVVDLRKFPPAKGAVQTLRVSGTSGDVYSIRLALVYDITALSRAAPQIGDMKSSKDVAMPMTRASAPSPQKTASTQGTTLPIPTRVGQPSAAPDSAAVPQGQTITRIATALPKGEGSAPVTPQLPCLDGICIGSPATSLNAPFEPVLSVAKQLIRNIPASKKFPDIEARAAHLDAVYRKGDMDQFDKDGLAWMEVSREDKIAINLHHLRQAYNIALQALGGKHSPEVVELAKYFAPQSSLSGYVRSVGSKDFAFDVLSNPLAFTETRALRFDQGFVDLLNKAKPTFCGVYRLSGQYKSKSGHETLVELQSDIDGIFKVANIERLFASRSSDSVELLEQELKARYAPYEDANLVRVTRDRLLSLQLWHPFLTRITGPGSGATRALRDAFWVEGWLDFKGKALEQKGVMRAIAESNKMRIPKCRPQKLSMD